MNERRASVAVSPRGTLEASCVEYVLAAAGHAIVPAADARACAVVVVLAREMPQSPVHRVEGLTEDGLPVLILVHSFEPWTIALGRSVGAAGLLSLRSPVAQILASVEKVVAGGRAWSPDETSAADPVVDLTQRERDVMALVSLGRRDDEIARRLGITAHTVRAHVQHALIKLDVTHRHAAAALVRNSRLMTARLWDLESLDSLENLRVG